jgi:putative transposase
MKFAFIAKHRVIWPTGWLCGALGVSRGGFYAWLARPRSQRSRSDEDLGAKVRTSFIASDRTYGVSSSPTTLVVIAIRRRAGLVSG